MESENRAMRNAMPKSYYFGLPNTTILCATSLSGCGRQGGSEFYEGHLFLKLGSIPREYGHPVAGMLKSPRCPG